MKNLKKRLFGFALSLTLVAGMLPMGALAAEPCVHEELKKGVCQSCETAFVAAVGDTLFENMDDAMAAAASGDDHGVVVLTDLKDKTFQLEQIYFVVTDKSGLVFENCSFEGNHEKQVIYNAGSLILKNVTVKNTAGAYGVYSEWTEGTDLKTLTVHGGEFVGKSYGMGLKQMQLQLESTLVNEEEVLPVFDGEVADIHMEDSAVEVLCDLAETVYMIDSVTPGVFAFAGEYRETDEEIPAVKGSWFKSVHGEVQFDEEHRQWAQSGSIASAVTVDALEFTYDGTEKTPVVSAKLYGKELGAEDYTVTYTKNGAAVEKPVAAGTYQMTVRGENPYSESFVQNFEIKPAVLTVESVVAENKGYDGKKTVAIKEVKLNGICGEDEVSVSVTNLLGEVANHKVGTYDKVTLPEMTLTGAAAANYTLTQPTQAVATNVSIGKQLNAQLTLEVAVPESGYVYNGHPVEAAVVVKHGETEVSSENYEVTYENNINAGTATVEVKPVADGLYEFEALKGSFVIKPATLTVKSATTENKTYDGTKSVVVTGVELNGVIGTDRVAVQVSNVKGELADSKAAVYNKVNLSALALSGEEAANYTVSQTAENVTTNVTISKATVPTALEDVKTSVGVNVENLEIENLGKGMPADAGTLTYKNKHQDTASGSKVIVLQWNVDETGKLTSKLAAAAAGDKVLYEVTVSSENYKDTVVKVEVTLGSVAVDTSKVTVTPAAETLVYNGKEQHPAVEVKYGDAVLKANTDYEITYPQNSTDAGEKELTVQFKGNYSGTATAKYTISKAKISVSGVKAQDKTYDGTTKATVSATLSGVVSGDDVKVNAVGTFENKHSGSNKAISVTYTLSGADAANYELTATTGSTTAKITPISASSLSGRMSGLSAQNATSANKALLQNIVAQTNAALEDAGLSATEKTNLSNVKWTAEDMVDRIESAAAASATESIRKAANITKENVKIDDKALLAKAQTDLDAALTNYGGNYTTAEKNDIQAKKDRIAGALNVITRVQSAQTMIAALPNDITTDTTVDAVLKNTVEDAQNALNGLNDYEKSLVSEDQQQKLDKIAQVVEGANSGGSADNQQNNILLGTDGTEKEEGFKIPGWILVLAVICAAACGGGLFLYKRKQEENEYNW